ncbi:MAG: energy transducer TonB [Bacteroidetes bacterium]|nr:energy transducer TonB [Bacteroidota bacterium]
MEPQEKLTPQQFIIDRLHDVQRKVENGNIQDALAELKEVKAADSKNIYIIALEKQILKLTDTETTAELRSEIVKALPPMIERAVNDAQRRLAEKAQEPKEAKEKEAALEKLKSQYFQRADEYVEKGDYPHALEEIRRIYIIDPSNVVAKEYEQKIEQLASLKTKSEEPKGIEKTPQPQSIQEQQVEEEQPIAETKGKSKLPIILAAAVVVLGIGIWLMTSSGSKETQQQPTQEQSITSTEQPGLNSEIAEVETPQPESTTPVAKEQKNKQPEQKPVETKSAQQQSASSIKEEQRPAPEPKVEQPKQTTPPPQPVEQPAPTPPQQAQAQSPQPAPQPPEEAAPKPFVAIEMPPQIVKRATPKYPEIAYRMRIEGKVVVEVTVDPQGKPLQAKIAKSSSDVFNEAAIEAAMKSTYKPAMMSTGPVTAKVYVPFDFKLR